MRNRRPDADEDPGHEGDRGRENQGGQIDGGGGEPADVCRGKNPDQVEAPERKQDSTQGAACGQEERFGQQLGNETPTAGTQGGAHREFARAIERSGQLQVGHIGAGNEQDATDRGQEKVQALAIFAHAGLEQEFAVHTSARVRIGISPLKFRRDGVHLGARHGQGHTGPQTSDHGEAGMVAPAEDGRLLP